MNYIRIHRIQVPSQLAECQSAGTGCGWCRKAMRRLVEKMRDVAPEGQELQRWLDEEYPNSSLYSAGRKDHIAAGKGKPPKSA